VNLKPLIYADRGDFLEYAILEDAIRKYMKHLHIPAAQLYAGELRLSPKALGSARLCRTILTNTQHFGAILAFCVFDFLDFLPQAK
jgi:hypothetical protein